MTRRQRFPSSKEVEDERNAYFADLDVSYYKTKCDLQGDYVEKLKKWPGNIVFLLSS